MIAACSPTWRKRIKEVMVVPLGKSSKSGRLWTPTFQQTFGCSRTSCETTCKLTIGKEDNPIGQAIAYDKNAHTITQHFLDTCLSLDWKLTGRMLGVYALRFPAGRSNYSSSRPTTSVLSPELIQKLNFIEPPMFQPGTINVSLSHSCRWKHWYQQHFL